MRHHLSLVAGVGRSRPAPLAGRRRRSQRGAVTAETAMMLPVLVLITLALVWLLALAAAQTRVVDAAREVARAVARDDAARIRRVPRPPGRSRRCGHQGARG